MLFAPSKETQDAITNTGDILGGPVDFTINGQPFLPEPIQSKDLPISIWQSWVATPFEYVRDAAVKAGGYFIAPVADSVLGGISTVHSVTDDPAGTWEEYARQFFASQKEIVGGTEKILSGAIPFSKSIGNIFANPITTLVIVAAILALWFLGPVIKATGRVIT